jgi:uncharacterized protein YndB with AHSA1/START domain
MKEGMTTVHDTVVVRRSYDAPAARVFAAWSDAAALARWYVPGDATWSSKVLTHDFRPGGAKKLEFGPPGERYVEDCRYEDIVLDRRICFVMTILRGRVPLTTSLVTVELVESGARTELQVTDQIAILDGGDSAAGRERGWGETLDKLGPELARAGGRGGTAR